MKQILFGICLALAGCGETAVRYATPDPAPVEQVRVSYGAILVREVSLPTHAASEEISVASAGGQLLASSSSLWADDPVRAVTLGLTRALTDITRARVAPEPWPFESYPDVAVDVRIEEMLPMAEGTYRMRGMVFAAPEQGKGRDRARSFDLTVPYDTEAGVPAIAAARSVLVSQLAMKIAQDALR